MLYNLKARVFKAIGRNIEECRDAFEEGLEQGRILRRKHKEAREEIKANEKAKQEPEVYDEYSQTHTAYRDNPQTTSI